jgi:hypothetical protein
MAFGFMGLRTASIEPSPNCVTPLTVVGRANAVYSAITDVEGVVSLANPIGGMEGVSAGALPEFHPPQTLTSDERPTSISDDGAHVQASSWILFDREG